MQPSADDNRDRTHGFMAATTATDVGTVRRHLAEKVVEIWLDDAAEDFTGHALLFQLINLLVRLNGFCPRLRVVLRNQPRHPLLRPLAAWDDLLSGLGDWIAPFPARSRVSFERSGVTADVKLRIGPGLREGWISIYAVGWIVYLNEEPELTVASENTVGACVAAGIAAAEIFKRLLDGVPLRPGLVVRPAHRLIFSAFDYGLVTGPNPGLDAVTDVDDVAVVGLGGIGSALVSAASMLPVLRGTMSLIDHDALDPTNMNRHLVSRPGDEGLKVVACRGAMSFHPEVVAIPATYAESLARRATGYDTVVVGVDNDAVRRAIQASLPRLVLNAGTSDLASFRVTRHNFREGACLSCISRGDLVEDPAAAQLAQILGVDEQILRSLVDSGASVDEGLLRTGGRLDGAVIKRLAGLSVAEIQAALCGDVALTDDESAPAVSISFLSALPGFLLLGELIKERAFGASRPPLNRSANHTLVSVLGRLHPDLLLGYRAKREGCDCSRPSYQRAYLRAWGEVDRR